MFRADFTIADEVEVSLIKYHIVFHFRLLFWKVPRKPSKRIESSRKSVIHRQEQS